MIVLILFSSILSLATAAPKRTVQIMPVTIHSVHGDIMCASPHGEPNLSNCLEYRHSITADTHITRLENLGRGVLQGNQSLVMAFSNISSIEQKIEVEINTNSTFHFGWSNIDDTQSQLPADSTLITKLPIKASLTLAPNTADSIPFYLVCDYLQKNCCLQYPGNSCNHAHTGTGLGVHMIVVASVWDLEVTVLEQRGAVFGSITTMAHRHMGAVDKYSERTYIPINGGRAF